MILLHLSGENTELAREEALALAGTEEYEQYGSILLLNTKYNKILERLAFTHGIFEVFFISDEDKILQDIINFNFNKHYKENFRVKNLNLTGKETEFSERRLGEMIYERLQNPHVKLTNPKTQFFFIFASEKIICCRLIKNISKDFFQRKPHMKPEMHPTGLSPKLAKALINLTGIKKGTITDPFCGSGGILVEAGLMGMNSIGYDIDRIMLKRAEINLKHYKVKKYKIEQKDATSLNHEIDYIVTELPFGKNSKITAKPEELNQAFFRTLDKILMKKAVIAIHDNIDHKNMIKNTKLRINKEFSYYIHKSMTKKILLLE